MANIIINGNITINGNVTIANGDNDAKVSVAKDKFVDLIFKKRDNAKWGGRKAWNERLENYLMGHYWEVYEDLDSRESLTNSKTKEKALDYLMTIING